MDAKSEDKREENGGRRRRDREGANHGAGAGAGDREKKRYKDTIDGAAEEFVCPITTELPVDPVTARDSRVYERAAIKEHIRRSANATGRGLELRSPVTNERMGPELLPAVQVRNMLERLVLSGAITGEKADRWKGCIKNEKEVAKIKGLADSGNPAAMLRLGTWYTNGQKGLKKDKKVAYSWFKKIVESIDPDSDAWLCAMSCMAHILIAGGHGMEKNETEGMALLGVAAQGGSDRAAFMLGWSYFMGIHGLRVDPKMSKLWLDRAISKRGIFSDLSHEQREEAKELLKQLVGHQS